MNNDHSTREKPPLSPDTFKRFQIYLLISGVALVALGWVLRNLDFAKAVLLAFLIVLLNVFWTKNLVKTILLAGKPKGLFTFFYVFKFGLTAIVLILAMVRFGMDAVGVLVGLSSLMVATVIFAADYTWFRG